MQPNVQAVVTLFLIFIGVPACGPTPAPRNRTTVVHAQAPLTGPAVAARTQAWLSRRSRLADTCGMVRVVLQHHPLTAAAALVWSSDLSRPLQQMLFDTADSLTGTESSTDKVMPAS